MMDTFILIFVQISGYYVRQLSRRIPQSTSHLYRWPDCFLEEHPYFREAEMRPREGL